jgi:hypothetical protein
MTAIKYFTPQVHYLTIDGKYLTPNTTYFPSGQITGPLTKGTLTDWKSTPELKELAVNLTVASISNGGSFSASFLALEPIESEVVTVSVTLTASPLTAAGTVRFVIGRDGTLTVWVNNTPSNPVPTGVIGGLLVPFKWQLSLKVSGTVGLIATFEGRD